MENVNKRRRIFFSLSKLESGLPEINSKEIRSHFTFSVNAKKLKKSEFILKVTFLVLLPLSMLKLPNFGSAETRISYYS